VKTWFLSRYVRAFERFLNWIAPEIWDDFDEWDLELEDEQDRLW
jgi:hypothetical protein